MDAISTRTSRHSPAESGSRPARRSRCTCGSGLPVRCRRAWACTACVSRRVPITTPNTAANPRQPGDRSGRMRADSAVVEEWPVWLEVNGEPAVTWMCTPDQLEELVVGWLHGEGYIASLDDLVQLRPCAPDLGFWADVKPERVAQVKGERRKPVLASGCGAVATMLADPDAMAHSPPLRGDPPAPEMLRARFKELFAAGARHNETRGLLAPPLTHRPTPLLYAAGNRPRKAGGKGIRA